MQRSAAGAWLGGVLVSHDAPKPIRLTRALSWRGLDGYPIRQPVGGRDRGAGQPLRGDRAWIRAPNLKTLRPGLAGAEYAQYVAAVIDATRRRLRAAEPSRQPAAHDHGRTVCGIAVQRLSSRWRHSRCHTRLHQSL